MSERASEEKGPFRRNLTPRARANTNVTSRTDNKTARTRVASTLRHGLRHVRLGRPCAWHCQMVRRHRDGCIHPSSRCGDGRKRDSQSDGPNRTLQRRSRTPTQSPLPLPKQGEGIRRGQHRLVVPVEHEYARCCGVLSMCMASRRLELPFSPFLFLAPRRKRAIFPTAQHSQRRSNAQSNPV